jgi:hypothetical protein
MACGFPYCAGVDCKDCHKPRCNAIEYCDQWPSCSPACPLTSPNAGIKPCPFCGCPDTGLAQMPLRKGWLTVQCSRCEASGPWRTQECGMDPESPTAIRNGRLMSIAAILREQATGGRNG